MIDDLGHEERVNSVMVSPRGDWILTDGDDAIHAPIDFYRVPNCIQAEVGFPADGQAPETVDLVFVDFIAPFVLLAVKFSGGDYGKNDVQRYMEESFTEIMAQWISHNWPKNC